VDPLEAGEMGDIEMSADRLLVFFVNGKKVS